MEKVIDKNIPVIFQKLDTYESSDTRFIKVKIWLMHLGENLNGSYFDKEVVTRAIPSLVNTPILCYIEENSMGENDFSDHRMIMVREDGDFNIKYIGQAIGVIPETNNAKFEYRLCDDGSEREFLTCEALVWKKWDDPVDIFNRDIIKAQSMELHNDYEGLFKEDGLFHFTNFKFFGACALGKEVLPAMHNATIEAQFSYDGLFGEIQEKMEQFKQFSTKGGMEMEEVKLEQSTEEVVVEETVVESVEETQEETVEFQQEEVTETTEEAVEETPTEVVEEVVEQEEVVEFDYKTEYNKVVADFESLKNEFEKLEVENKELREFKLTKITEERKEAEESLYSQFSSELTEEEINGVKETASEFTLEQLEEKLFTLVGKKKATFSKQQKKEKQSIKIAVETNHTEEKLAYGGLFDRFKEK